MYKVIVKNNEYIIEDAWCIAEAVEIATTQYYSDTKETVYSDDESIIVTDMEKNISYKWNCNEKDWCEV